MISCFPLRSIIRFSIPSPLQTVKIAAAASFPTKTHIVPHAINDHNNHLSHSSPQTPLFLRPSTHSATPLELRQWRNWARDLALSVGSKFQLLDGGPDKETLLREVEWLLEDAVDDYKSHSSQLHLLTSAAAGAQNNRSFKLRIELEQLYRLWKQRIEDRRPFQYLVGCEHWKDLVLSVEEGVLIPRPETVQIVDMVEELVGEIKFRDGVWADLGTGSGAIAIGIARVLQRKGGRGRVMAVDLSGTAVATAKYNVKSYGLQEKVEVRHGSWFEPLQDFQGKLVGLVSNPPYIPSNQINRLQSEVRKHEPRNALDGGEDGTDDLQKLCRGSVSALSAGGFLAFETNGKEQAESVADFLNSKLQKQFNQVKLVSDYQGIPRFVTGFRS